MFPSAEDAELMADFDLLSLTGRGAAELIQGGDASPAELADAYHARIAVRGTTISPATKELQS